MRVYDLTELLRLLGEIASAIAAGDISGAELKGQFLLNRLGDMEDE